MAGGYLAVILSWAVWKRSWAGHDPTQSKTAAAKVVATTGIAMQDQQLIAYTTGQEHVLATWHLV